MPRGVNIGDIVDISKMRFDRRASGGWIAPRRGAPSPPTSTPPTTPPSGNYGQASIQEANDNVVSGSTLNIHAAAAFAEANDTLTSATAIKIAANALLVEASDTLSSVLEGSSLGPYLPGSPYSVLSVSRRMMPGFSSPAVRLYRVSDAAEQDFSFKTNTDYLDKEAILAWAGGSQMKIRTIYNQISGAPSLQQATVASMPRFYFAGNFGVQANDTPGGGNNTNTPCGMAATVSVDRALVSIFQTERSYFSTNRCYFELATGSTRDLGIIGSSTGAVSAIGAATIPATALMKSQVQTNSVVGSTTQTDVRLGDQSFLGLAAQASKTSTTLNLARGVSDSTKLAASDIYANVIYKEIRSDAADIHTLMRTMFGEVAARAKRLVYDGDSLTSGYYNDYGYTRAYLINDYVAANTDLFNVSTYGFRFASANTAVATRVGNIIRATDTLVVTLGINDIAADNTSASALITLLTTYLSNLRAVVSPKIVVCTIPVNANLIASGRDATATSFNSMLIAQATALGITVARNDTNAGLNSLLAAGDPSVSPTTTNIHYLQNGTALIAAEERGAILTANAA